MPRPKMADAHRQKIRGQILDRAYAILTEKGRENISSRTIAQHLDLTHMGLFTYFPNQAAILQALAEREQMKFLDQLQPLKKRAENEDIARVVEETLSLFQKFARENPNLFRLIWIEPETGGPPLWMQTTIDLVAGFIRKGQEQGVFLTSDAQISATLVISLVNMPFILTTSRKIINPALRDELSREALASAMLYLLHGIEPGQTAILKGWKMITSLLKQSMNWLRRWFTPLAEPCRGGSR